LWDLVLLAGYGLTRLIPHAEHPPTSIRETKSHERPQTREKRPWRSEDFRQYIQQITISSTPLSPELKSWTEQEIKAALEEGIHTPEACRESSSARSTLQALLMTWAERDFDSALAWLDQLPSEAWKTTLASTLGAAVPDDKALDAFSYVCKNRGYFETANSSGSGEIFKKAIQQAALQGPAAVVEILTQARHADLNGYAENWKFPKGFDFVSLNTMLASKGETATFHIGPWMAQNREEAIQHLMLDSDQKISPAVLFSDVLPLIGSPQDAVASERAVWLAGKLDQLKPDQLQFMKENLVDTLQRSPATLTSFTNALTDLKLKQDMVLKGTEKLLVTEGMDRGFRYLEETLNSNEEKLHTLEKLNLSRPVWLRSQQKESLRTKLTEWGASQERIDDIMKRMESSTS
jgi:hypothetical protein